MGHTLIHDEVINGEFSESTHVARLETLEQALNYYESQLVKPLALRTRKSHLEALGYLRGAGHHLPDFDEPQDYGGVLHPDSLKKFRGTVSTGSRDVALKIKWPNLWKVHFYKNKNFGGNKVSLDCKWTDFSMDSTLVDNSFNDTISSIDVGKFVICAIASRDVNFGGDWWWFFKDDKNLVNNGCNDQISAIAATGFSIPTMISALQAITG